MIRQMIRAKKRQVIIDMNTQQDFFLAKGAICVRNHKRILTHIRRIMAWARITKTPVISICEVYHANNGSYYCIDNTEGQKKLTYTKLDQAISFPADGNSDLPIDILRKNQQIILHKRCTDPFEEPRIERLLSEVHAAEFLVIGALAESAVKALVLGLLQRNKKVTVIADALGSLNSKEGDIATRKMKAKGAKIIETKKLVGESHLQNIHACDCKRCRGLLKTKKEPVHANA